MRFFKTLEKQPCKRRSDFVLNGQMRVPQGDCREEARRAHKIHISAQNGPFGQPGR